MRKFENITVDEVIARRDKIEIAVAEEKAKVVGLKNEKTKLYELMFDKLVKGLQLVNDTYKELKIEKEDFNTGFSVPYTPYHNGSPYDAKVCITFKQDQKNPIVYVTYKNDYHTKNDVIWDGTNFENWYKREMIVTLYSILNDFIPTVRQQLADEYIRVKNEQLEKIQRKYEKEMNDIEEMKRMLVG
jgi:hypothetical protein